MLIRVRHKSGACDYVKPHVLDRLIGEGKLLSFHRRTGVVVVGVHSVRGESALAYYGAERRHRVGGNTHAA